MYLLRRLIPVWYICLLIRSMVNAMQRREKGKKKEYNNVGTWWKFHTLCYIEN